MESICIVANCESKAAYLKKKYCGKHYTKIKRYGSVKDIVCYLCNRQTTFRGKINRPDRKDTYLKTQRFFEDKTICHNCYKRILQEVIFYKLNEKCNCCGENNRYFLQIDHINNDGFKDRKERYKDQLKYYTNIINNINNFQLLCANCNFGKLMNKGVCPHKGIKKLFGKNKKGVNDTGEFSQKELSKIQNFAKLNFSKVFK